jgi:hypothetical protein
MTWARDHKQNRCLQASQRVPGKTIVPGIPWRPAANHETLLLTTTPMSSGTNICEADTAARKPLCHSVPLRKRLPIVTRHLFWNAQGPRAVLVTLMRKAADGVGGGGADVDLRVASVDEKRRQPSPLDGGRCVQPLQGAPWGSSRRGPQGTLRRQCISLTAAGPCGLRSPSARRIKWERVHGVRTPRTVLDSYTAFTPETGSQKGTGQHFLMGSGYFPMGPGWTATQHVTGHQQSRTMASGQLSKKTKRRTVRARYAPLPPDLFPTQPKRIRICCTPNGPPCGASSRRRWGVWGWWVNGM